MKPDDNSRNVSLAGERLKIELPVCGLPMFSDSVCGMCRSLDPLEGILRDAGAACSRTDSTQVPSDGSRLDAV